VPTEVLVKAETKQSWGIALANPGNYIRKTGLEYEASKVNPMAKTPISSKLWRQSTPWRVVIRVAGATFLVALVFVFTDPTESRIHGERDSNYVRRMFWGSGGNVTIAEVEAAKANLGEARLLAAMKRLLRRHASEGRLKRQIFYRKQEHRLPRILQIPLRWLLLERTDDGSIIVGDLQTRTVIDAAGLLGSTAEPLLGDLTSLYSSPHLRDWVAQSIARIGKPYPPALQALENELPKVSNPRSRKIAFKAMATADPFGEISGHLILQEPAPELHAEALGIAAGHYPLWATNLWTWWAVADLEEAKNIARCLRMAAQLTPQRLNTLLVEASTAPLARKLRIIDLVGQAGPAGTRLVPELIKLADGAPLVVKNAVDDSIQALNENLSPKISVPSP